MKRYALIIMILSLLFISSCGFNSLDLNTSSEYDPRYSNQAQDRIYNEETLILILECFDNRDSETLKKMFSPYIQSEYDLDKQINETFLAYNGVSILYDGFWDHGIKSEYINDGVILEKKIGAAMENIKTDNDKTYYISFEKYVVHDANEDMLGLYNIVLHNENYSVISIIGSNKLNE